MSRFFEVQITEVLQMVESIKADTAEEAVDKAREDYSSGEIVLDADNSNVEATFMLHDPDYPLPSVTDRYMLLADYMNNQSDANWYRLMSELEELRYGN